MSQLHDDDIFFTGEHCVTNSELEEPIRVFGKRKVVIDISDADNNESDDDDDSSVTFLRENEIFDLTVLEDGYEEADENDLLKDHRSNDGFDNEQDFAVEPAPKPLVQRVARTERSSPEATVLSRFAPSVNSEVPGSFDELYLQDFQIYRSADDCELPEYYEPLHTIQTGKKVLGRRKTRKVDLYFDGTISGTISRANGPPPRHVQDLLVEDIRIGGIADMTRKNPRPTKATCIKDIWIYTHQANKVSCCYRVGRPFKNYDSVHRGFVWLADLVKHVFDYLAFAALRRQKVQINDFRDSFIQRLQIWHQGNEAFENWHAQCDKEVGFRRIVTSSSHAQFLQYMACTFIQSEAILAHPFWRDIGYQKSRSHVEKESRASRTLLTPNAAKVFTRTYPSWSPFIKIENMKPAVKQLHDRREHELNLSTNLCLQQMQHFKKKDGLTFAQMELERSRYWRSIDKSTRVHELMDKVVIVRLPLENSSGSGERHRFANEHRYGMVKEVYQNCRVRVVWLVMPSNTICAGPNPERLLPVEQRTCYPLGNELFFSDRCNCATVPLSNVVKFYEASFFTNTLKYGAQFLVRQLYLEQEEAFVNPGERDLFTCCHNTDDVIPTKERPSQPSSCNSTAFEAAQSRHFCTDQRCIRSVFLFSGCGLFDHGLEEGSGRKIKTVLAVECNEDAVLSHRANQPAQDSNPLCIHANVVDILSQILKGERLYITADLIAAGCPCPGFCLANNKRCRPDSQKLCSLLAHTLSWVEVLLPKIVLIENVPTMDTLLPSAAGQAISFLVALGYQVRKTVLKSSDVGGCTTRERLFIVASVPTVTLPTAPGVFEDDDIVAAKSATSHLPEIHNDLLVNPSRPDHIPAVRLSQIKTSIVQKIPTQPLRGTDRMGGIASAIPRMSHEELVWFESLSKEQRNLRKSKSLHRVHPDTPFHTLMTSIEPMCARFGTYIHWKQHRVLSFEEIRTIQNTPSSFILVGNLKQQIKQIGNSVAWPVATAWGRSIAKAWDSKPTVTLREENAEQFRWIPEFHDRRSDTVRARSPRSTPLEESMHDLEETLPDVQALVARKVTKLYNTAQVLGKRARSDSLTGSRKKPILLEDSD